MLTIPVPPKRKRLDLYYALLFWRAQHNPPKNAGESLDLLSNTLDEIEDLLSGEEKLPHPPDKDLFTERMYPPDMVYLTWVNGNVRRYKTRSQYVDIYPNGQIQIFLRKSGHPGLQVYP